MTKLWFVKIDCETSSIGERKAMMQDLIKQLEKYHINDIILIEIDSRMDISSMNINNYDDDMQILVPEKGDTGMVQKVRSCLRRLSKK
jgi:hypothetical protein